MSSQNDPQGFLTEIARRYYIEGETQDKISKELAISRMKVNRLIKQAQDEGLVEFRVHIHSSSTSSVARKLAEAFKIERVLIAPDALSEQQRRRNVATVVSNFLEGNLQDGSIISVGMGRNVAAVTELRVHRILTDLTFVSGCGGALEAGNEGNADHICRRLARGFGGTANTMYAPAYVRDEHVRNELLRHPTIRKTLNLAKSADYALIGIGDLGLDSHMARMGWFSSAELEQARELGVVGDIMGYDFFDINGQSIDATLGGRVIGLAREDITNIPNSIAIASEASKVQPIIGALRTGAINTLATTMEVCLAIENLVDSGV